jgi:hypothetical protein
VDEGEIDERLAVGGVLDEADDGSGHGGQSSR